MLWTDAAVRAALALDPRSSTGERPFSAISTDTRTLPEGALFIALRGERHDGHAFLAEAAQRGAGGALVDHVPEHAPTALSYYVVPDTLAGLGRLARLYRRRVGAPVCAVTGTNGKTTTKDMLRAVLGTRFRVHATAGNLNNLVGTPLTLLSAPSDCELMIVELGTNAPGEIARLASIVEPDIAVITSVSAGHLEGLGDLSGVLDEKTSLLSWLPRDGYTVVADEPPELVARARRIAPGEVAVAGIGESADPEYRATAVDSDVEGRSRFHWEGLQVQLDLRGRHQVRNALLALAVSRRFGIPAETAVSALAELHPVHLRTEFLRLGALTLIADCYNANPASVTAAIDLLRSVPRQGGRVVVLGTMLELGEESAALHAETARQVAAAGLDLIVATGAFHAAFQPLEQTLGDRLIRIEDPLAAFPALTGALRGDEVVLLKASRGVELERLLPRFEERWGVLHPHGEALGPRERSSDTGLREEAHSAEHSPTDNSPGDTGRVARSHVPGT